jgi:hypothetical protein
VIILQRVSKLLAVHFIIAVGSPFDVIYIAAAELGMGRVILIA